MKLEVHGSREDAISRAVSILGLEGSVNLFLSGGSSFDVFRAADDVISDSQASQTSLFQIDERYGMVGHKDSNWNLTDDIRLDRYASIHPILKPHTAPAETAKDYEQSVQDALVDGTNVAILGVGDDAHVAGVKPMPPKRFEVSFSGKQVANYEWEDYSRITLTLEALMKFDRLVVFASGEAKQIVIDSLDQERSVHNSPIHGLINHPDLTIIYSKG